MTAKDGFYGRDDVDYRKDLVPNSNEKYFLQVNEKTGDMEVWNEEFGSDKYVGVYKKDEDGNYKKFEENENWWGGASKEEKKFFKSAEGLKATKDFAVQTIKKDLTNANITDETQTPEAAGANASQFIDEGAMTTPPDATSNEVANESSNKFKEELAKIENEVGTNIGITQEIGSQPLRYPTDMADNQDVIKFSLIKYKVNDIKSGETFGRERIKPNAKVGNGDRLILGTVILPVPGQIQDTNRADWSDDSANAGQLAVGGLFGAAATGGDVGAEFTKMSDAVVGNSTQVQAAITGALGNTATGVNLLGRMGGLVINPNLELLFSKPSLREFSLNFRLSARSSAEGQEVIKIIRFFKQGMAPIREPSNLFLKAPNTFQVHYLLRGDTSGEHPFIGRMKECALTSVNTSYTPENNYATYEDGLMVSYQISLTLKELEPVYNDSYKDIPSTEIGF